MKKKLWCYCLIAGVTSLSLAYGDPAASTENSKPQYQFAQQDQRALVPEQASVQAEPTTAQQRLGLIGQIDGLQSQFRKMQGQLEQQQHELQQLQLTQREMYADLDKRIKALQANGTAAAAPTQSQTKAPETTTASNSNDKDVLSQQQAYQKAYDLIKAQRYTDAQTSLQDYLQKYPEGEYAVNAHYWLGELSLLAGDSQTAGKEFSVVVSKYPKSQKTPDATLKLGFLAYDQEQWDVAKKYLTDVETKYPNTSAAKLARNRLQTMKQEGH